MRLAADENLNNDIVRAIQARFRLRGDLARRIACVRDAIVKPAVGRNLIAPAPVRKRATFSELGLTKKS